MGLSNRVARLEAMDHERQSRELAAMTTEALDAFIDQLEQELGAIVSPDVRAMSDAELEYYCACLEAGGDPLKWPVEGQ